MQQDMASRAARAKKTRRRSELLSKDSEERQALDMEIAELSAEEVAKQLLQLQQSDLQRQALNEVLYSKDFGSDWGKEGEKYMDLLDAVIQRSEEIAAQAEEEGLDVPNFSDDEEWNRLNDLQQLFQDEVSERFNELADDALNQMLVTKDADQIRKDYMKRHIDAEADTVWYMEYKLHMLYYATRTLDDHKKLYFESATEVMDMPPQVQRQLLEALESISREVDDLKNSLTPLPS